jgi:cysteinyl-tRNA synthetase
MVVGDLNLYNTRTRSVERFVPLQDDRVRIYVCGLTPSAQAHLGHARSFLFFDLLRRYLEHRGYDVTYVQNVTDIDDRSIATARRRSVSYRDVVGENFSEFKDSMRRLDVREPDVEPYATAYIPQIQAMIRKLIEIEHAYVAEDGIYYAVDSFTRYGALSNRNVEELEAGARIEVGEHKRDPLDFALWKFAKAGGPAWPFDPYGDGRPGWHIECSAMSRELLDADGVGFDIHGGGADLIFPHHENEIAQSEPLMQHPPMANFWVHGGLLLFDMRKMSKSLGNFEPLVDLLKRHDPQAIRLLFLQTGYRKVMNFTEEAIAGASVVLARIKAGYRTLKLGPEAKPVKPVGVAAEKAPPALMPAIEAALDDDMNTAVALSEVLRFVADASSYAANETLRETAFKEYERVLRLLGLEPKASWMEVPRLAENFVAKLESALGPSASLAFDGVGAEEAIERVIEMRNDARKKKDWQTSDHLRDALASCGVALHDTKDGTAWSIAP